MHPPSNGDETPRKRGRPKVSTTMGRYPALESMDVGEYDDNASTERNRNALSKELERPKPRKEVVLSLLRQTYRPRRDEVLSDSEDVASILSRHPALSLPYAVSNINFVG